MQKNLFKSIAIGGIILNVFAIGFLRYQLNQPHQPTPEKKGVFAQSTSSWLNVTSNLANMASQCGNMTMLSAVPNSNTVIAGIALDGLWASDNGGISWYSLGAGSGSAVITNRPSWITYDTNSPTTFWESGIYNSGGAYKTINTGNTFQQLGSVTHDDFISVDFTDPNRQTLLVGGHEQSQSVWKSTDGGQTWTNIGLNLPSGTGFSSDPLVINSQTYVVNTDTSWGGGSPGIYRTTNGGQTWTKISSIDPVGAPLYDSNGIIYWASGNSLAKSTDKGLTWTIVGSGLQTVHPIELSDGALVSVGSNSLMISSDQGSTWNPIGPTLPYNPAGVIYSVNDKAFYMWHWDCGNTVLSDAIMKLNYDFGLPTPTPSTTTVTSGDINEDGVVDLTDLSILARNWMEKGPNIQPPTADLNGDGVVDLTDLSILAKNWGK